MDELELVRFVHDLNVGKIVEWFIGQSKRFPNMRYMDNLFFKPHELAARDRKGKTENYP